MQTMPSTDRPLVSTPAPTSLRHSPLTAALELGTLPGFPTPPPKPNVLGRRGHTAKRVLDIVISLITLIAVMPVMLIVAIAVKRSSPGPVLFRQERIGQDGQPFLVLKFRSMSNGAHADLVRDAVAHRRYQENGFKLDADDPRITRVGRFIRATSLDELPQLVNVLVGEMSLVGIRPLLADELSLRSEYDQSCYRALKPGMTGLWQVSGRSSVVSCDRHQLDREYIETWNVKSDLSVLFRTPIAVLRVGHSR